MTSRELSMTLEELAKHIYEQIQQQYFAALATLLSSWFLVRQKYLKEEYDQIKKDVARLDKAYSSLEAKVDNVTTNQKLIRSDVAETKSDVKKLLARRNRWW